MSKGIMGQRPGLKSSILSTPIPRLRGLYFHRVVIVVELVGRGVSVQGHYNAQLTSYWVFQQST